MSSSFHERHRQVLLGLGDERVTNRFLNRAGCTMGWFDDDRLWVRSWARVVDSRRGRIQAAFETVDDPFEILMIECGSETGMIDKDLGTVAVRRFPDDPKIAGLSRLLEANPTAVVVRYRFAKRCTLYVDSPAPRFLKIFPDDRGRRLNREAGALSAASRSGELKFDVAAPLGFDPNINTFAQSAVAGVPVAKTLLSGAGPALAARLGAAAGSIPRSGLRPEMVLDPAVEYRRSRRRAAEIAAMVPALADELDRFMDRLLLAHEAITPRDLLPIHGSPHTNQWLIHNERLALVDFDRLSLGDPELDVATFAGEMDFETEARVNDVNEAFVDGYISEFGELDPVRLSMYRAHKRLAKVYRTATSIRVDASERAASHLESAVSALQPIGL